MKLSTLVTVWFAVLVIGAVFAIGASTPKRIEIETGRNTLEMRQAIERERLATKEQMQQRQIEAEAARRYESGKRATASKDRCRGLQTESIHRSATRA